MFTKKIAAVAVAVGMMMPLMSGTVLAAVHCTPAENEQITKELATIKAPKLHEEAEKCVHKVNTEGFGVHVKGHPCANANELAEGLAPEHKAGI